MKWAKKEDNWRVPVKCWASEIEDGAVEQYAKLAQMPCVFHHVAAMPDSHAGYANPIGSVVAYKDAISPYGIGSDAGCGMHTFRTNIPASELSDMRLRREIQEEFKKVIPVGMAIHSKEQEWIGFDNYENDASGHPFLVNDRVRKSLSSIGSGNHFCSIEKAVWVDDSVKGGEMGEEGFAWGLIHTGSRNLGKQLADYYHNLAVQNCKKWFSQIPADEYAFLPTDSDLGQAYLRDMEYALAYALENRNRISRAMQNVLRKFFPAMEVLFEYDIHHNYARLENHFGENVWVHRKGATSARKDEICIIPGSMGTASYICLGLGNEESFSSCSHGAGRKMSRSAATNSFTVEDCDKAMEGIVCERWSKYRFGPNKGKIDLSESPGAYKDIEQVVKDEEDLVKPLVKLMPLCNLKG